VRRGRRRMRGEKEDERGKRLRDEKRELRRRGMSVRITLKERQDT
jgi:hypothetical protein